MEHAKQKTTERAALTPGDYQAESAADPRLAVYFDGSCPLCRAEISFYRNHGSKADFIDISAGEGAPEEVGCAAALKRFHVRRTDGKLLSGAAAFAQLWKATPGWRLLGHVGAVPPFVWIGEGLYRAFLLIRPAIQNAVRARAG